ncbi:hypothetical protein D3C84_1221520 [compost metagenome]
MAVLIDAQAGEVNRPSVGDIADRIGHMPAGRDGFAVAVVDQALAAAGVQVYDRYVVGAQHG